MPVSYATTYDFDRDATTFRKYYDNIAMILDRMEEEAETVSVSSDRIMMDQTKPNVLHLFCRNISLVAIDAEKSVYDSLLRIMKKLSSDHLADLDTVVEGSSPFYRVVQLNFTPEMDVF